MRYVIGLPLIGLGFVWGVLRNPVEYNGQWLLGLVISLIGVAFLALTPTRARRTKVHRAYAREIVRMRRLLLASRVEALMNGEDSPEYRRLHDEYVKSSGLIPLWFSRKAHAERYLLNPAYRMIRRMGFITIREQTQGWYL